MTHATNRDRAERAAIRHAYEQHGVRDYYDRFGAAYRNPHEPIVRRLLPMAVERWNPDRRAVLDLACGSGEVTLALHDLGITSVEGADPYTGNAYMQRVGTPAYPWSFEDTAKGAISERRYSLIICSFAMHLVERSRLPILTYELSRIAGMMIVITPHKRPHIEPAWGWALHDEIIYERVRARLYSSLTPQRGLSTTAVSE